MKIEDTTWAEVYLHVPAGTDVLAGAVVEELVGADLGGRALCTVRVVALRRRRGAALVFRHAAVRQLQQMDATLNECGIKYCAV